MVKLDLRNLNYTKPREAVTGIIYDVIGLKGLPATALEFDVHKDDLRVCVKDGVSVRHNRSTKIPFPDGFCASPGQKLILSPHSEEMCVVVPGNFVSNN